MPNPFVELRNLLGPAPLQVGTVTAYSGGTATIELPDGSTVQARGDTSIGAAVYLRGELIEGPAPSLPVVAVTV